MTTREKIREWLERGKVDEKLTHMLVVCDTFDYEYYPVYVTNNQNIREINEEYSKKNMQRVMEVYSYRKDFESQLNERRSFNYD